MDLHQQACIDLATPTIQMVHQVRYIWKEKYLPALIYILEKQLNNEEQGFGISKNCSNMGSGTHQLLGFKKANFSKPQFSEL